MTATMTTAMTDNKGPIQRAYQQVVAGRFMRWWVGELQSLVPSWLRTGQAALDGVGRFALGELEAASGNLVSGHGAGAVLEVPAPKVLRRSVRLPIATEENLRQVLEFQMEQYTPFSAAQLYFSHAVLTRDFDKGLLEVELVAVQRTVVDGAIHKLQDAGYTPLAVQATDGDGGVLPYNLLPVLAGGRPSMWRNGPLPWLLALVLILAIAALALPLFIQREAAIQLIPLVDRSKKAAESVDSVRRELDAKIAQHNYLLEKRMATPTTIQALEELTRVLPDDTWVQTLDWKGKEIVIQGETASSVKLVGLFEQSSMFKDASFRSPLTKGQTPGVERFSLALQLRPPQPPASKASAGVSP